MTKEQYINAIKQIRHILYETQDDVRIKIAHIYDIIDGLDIKK